MNTKKPEIETQSTSEFSEAVSGGPSMKSKCHLVALTALLAISCQQPCAGADWPELPLFMADSGRAFQVSRFKVGQAGSYWITAHSIGHDPTMNQ